MDFENSLNKLSSRTKVNSILNPKTHIRSCPCTSFLYIIYYDAASNKHKVYHHKNTWLTYIKYYYNGFKKICMDTYDYCVLDIVQHILWYIPKIIILYISTHNYLSLLLILYLWIWNSKYIERLLLWKNIQLNHIHYKCIWGLWYAYTNIAFNLKLTY